MTKASTMRIIWRLIKTLQEQSRADIIAAKHATDDDAQYALIRGYDDTDNTNEEEEDADDARNRAVTTAVEMDMEILQICSL
mmetsp:Transcript_152/g.158  ORF Transcript_152/g.158 Transcript_152/m.158 type:complete len:82 (+) Transcript_152:260-505(+)|eukprot:CAMPEP_0198273876 /NCGR_PEP_ID=MMETSP1447-20131203/58308_1 /TAXON_ID=420782 /ORGANISM="Chaetoceros dichaeta, Strain CCMP1751" /LENGTH=81 /DNA_ID=CAMNT_0043967755 /DNA_START=131 /DNA_END=376 /DNA_ORIENTATION=+